nr:putative late blight resistance protein homolog R1B-14 [Ipomoea batatas]
MPFEHKTQVAVLHENNIIGFDDDLEAIKVRLEASNDFVIPIVGTAGIGKTTFALEIFEDPEIRKIFTHCIWVHVSQGFHRKQNFIHILHQISKPTEDFSMISEDQLEAKIKETLENQKYFIVLDDVRQEKDWNSLKAAFPENLNGSKVLVTTRYSNVVDSTRKSHILGGLSNDDGWLIIKNNVFGANGGYSDPLLQDLGKRIAKHCNGLPLGLLLVSGILRKCRTIDDWQRVAEYPPLLNIWSDGPSIQELVWLSYENLPHVMLKNCLLYFAFFPIGYEIAAWKLIRLWIAEEFIPTIDEWGYPLDVEVEAQKYLNDLVDRNLVRMTKRGADGQIQTCNIHDTLHESFKIKATWTDLFKVLDEGRRLNENISLSRRLCFIHSSTMDIFDAENNSPRLYLSCYNKRRSPLPSGDEHVHSLLLSTSQKSEIHLTPKQLATIPNTFPLLKVLNIESLKFSSLPNELYGLFLLRYLAITGDIDSLPKSFKNLRELETLVIKTTKGTLHINGGIWNMRNLRHVHTNTSTQLPPPPKTAKNSFGGTNIHTLSTISPESCTNEIFEKIPNLQILGVRGDLSDLLEEKQDVCMFNNLQMLCLDNLKLHGNSEKVLKVPMLNKFASKLRKLTLSGTFFQWNDMTVLGSLEELEVLKLDDNAFCGQRWDLSSDVIFKQLQYLRIGRMNLRTWTAVEESFPVLESLVLRNCIFLENIPFSFANVLSLKVMDLFHVSESAADSARKIGEQRHGCYNWFPFPLIVYSIYHVHPGMDSELGIGIVSMVF